MPIVSKLSVIFMLFSSLSLWAAAEKPSELARVAILEFTDTTGQANYGWIKTSLPDAIYESMKAHFEFERADASAVEKSAAKSTDATRGYSSTAIEYYSKAYNFDIVIFGDYTYDAQTKLATITANVYHREGKRIIGTVVEKTKLNNDVFAKIETISKKIIEKIYRFSLDLNERDAAEKRESDVRLLVLVPTWKDAAGKKAAIAELAVQKKELKKRYDAQFLTIFEFFTQQKTPPAQQKNIEELAKTRNDTAIGEWLKGQKVSNAMIVFVSENKVNLMPITSGKAAAPITYAVGATNAEKANAIDAAVTTSGMRENLQRTAIKKQPGIRDKFSLALGGFFLSPVGTGASSINASLGYELSALYRFVNFWIFQLGASAVLEGTTQKHTRADGDPDFALSYYAGMAGPTIVVPMPFYRSLELHVSLLAGGVYSQLQKYKYIDTTLSEQAFNAIASAQSEVRWHIVRGLFIGAAASYQRVFYPGTNMQFATFHLRAGYRF